MALRQSDGTPTEQSGQGAEKLKPGHPDGMVKLLAIVVLYKLAPEASPTLRTLLHSCKSCTRRNVELTIVVWDNTPGGQEVSVPEQVRYIAAPMNVGLARAYNEASALALEEGIDWLLTLDQDSVLPESYLEDIASCIARLGSISVAAVVPLVTDGNRVISPYRLLAGALPRWYVAGYNGTPTEATYAVNSAAVLSVAALQAIGGYDPLFPLDLSDTSLFHRLHGAGYRVHICGEVRVHHELALLAKKERMSTDRYRSGLMDECAFYDMQLSALARFERVVRLLGRVFKDSFEPQMAEFRSITMAEVRRRVFTQRSNRIATWTLWAYRRIDAQPEGVHALGARKS